MAITSLPPQGTPGVADQRNPTLVPNFDKPVVGAVQAGGMQSPAAFLAANPRTDSTQTVTLGGSVTTGDDIAIIVTNPIFKRLGLNPPLIAKDVTAAGGDTLTSLAAAFAKAFNTDVNAIASDLSVDAVGPVLTFRHGGPVGNLSVITSQLEEATITIAGTALTGDTLFVSFNGPQMGPTQNITVKTPITTGNTPTQIATAIAAVINANAALIARGITASPAAAVVTMTIPPAQEPLDIIAWVNSAPLVATIAGTFTAADVVSLIFTSAQGIVGSPVTIARTVVGGDTATTVAAALVAAINASPALSSAGISATNIAGAITIAYPDPLGQLRLTSSVTGAATETVTITATPTDTVATATAATETVTIGGSGGKLTGGLGPVFAANNFNWSSASGQVQSFFYGQPYLISFPQLTAMATQGAPFV